MREELRMLLRIARHQQFFRNLLRGNRRFLCQRIIPAETDKQVFRCQRLHDHPMSFNWEYDQTSLNASLHQQFKQLYSVFRCGVDLATRKQPLVAGEREIDKGAIDEWREAEIQGRNCSGVNGVGCLERLVADLHYLFERRDQGMACRGERYAPRLAIKELCGNCFFKLLDCGGYRRL